MQLIRVENLDAAVKMKPNEVRMTPIRGRHPDIEVKTNVTGVADPDAMVKMKRTE